MEKLYKFTFKQDKGNVWNPYLIHNIKYRGNEVGYIFENEESQWIIHLQVPASEKALEKNPNCPWMWGNVSVKFPTAEEAKAWINENREKVLNTLYLE